MLWQMQRWQQGGQMLTQQERPRGGQKMVRLMQQQAQLRRSQCPLMEPALLRRQN
jgi:hypothetical protein